MTIIWAITVLEVFFFFFFFSIYIKKIDKLHSQYPHASTGSDHVRVYSPSSSYSEQQYLRLPPPDPWYDLRKHWARKTNSTIWCYKNHQPAGRASSGSVLTEAHANVLTVGSEICNRSETNSRITKNCRTSHGMKSVFGIVSCNRLV